MATSDRGFAHMDKNKQKEIASKGGQASHSSRGSSSTGSSTRGAAGSTDAVKRGGQNSRRNS